MSLTDEVAERGFAIARRVVRREQLDELIGLCLQSNRQNQTRRGESLFGIRHLLSAVPRLYEIVASSPFIELVRAVLGGAARPVKGVYFDKTPGANWPVPWHQDMTITVREHRDVAGYEMRPVKDGVVHALPPVELSDQMLALRIHLDDAEADHGALRVIPGSHRGGRLDQNQTAQWLSGVSEVVCSVAAGDVMMMRPLLLHASSPCQRPEHRRVIQIEYAAFNLPGGLEWAG
ncbi:MAG: phytanoyl-CoA dioxygenase family protein [Candidatus Saccharimonas sp.]|nr:phytanoyl-CoA dioxygenase family protein [Planctomycetaceae bacterium]